MTIHLDFKWGVLSPEHAMIVVSALTGAVTPWINAFFIRSHWSPKAKIAVTTLICVLLAGVQCALMGQLTGTNILTAFALIWPTSQAIYASVAKKLGIENWEAATDFSMRTDAEPIAYVNARENTELTQIREELKRAKEEIARLARLNPGDRQGEGE